MSDRMSNEVLLVSKETLTDMKQYYTTCLKSSTPPGAFFAAKKGAVNVTGYNSGKVLFQGADSEKEAEDERLKYRKLLFGNPKHQLSHQKKKNRPLHL